MAASLAATRVSQQSGSTLKPRHLLPPQPWRHHADLNRTIADILAGPHITETIETAHRFG